LDTFVVLFPWFLLLPLILALEYIRNLCMNNDTKTNPSDIDNLTHDIHHGVANDTYILVTAMKRYTNQKTIRYISKSEKALKYVWQTNLA
jgi:hypothetical protein